MEQSFKIEERFTVYFHPHQYHVDFMIFDDEDKDYADKGLLVEGSVKFDGCSNWKFHTEEVMMHMCSYDDLLRLGRILAACWSKAQEFFTQLKIK